MTPTVPPPADPTYDIEFFWDPVCPFAWITSRWVEQVAAQRDFSVDWRFISLRLINKDKDYATEFPPEYEFGHTAGLRMLRVAAAIRHELGREPLGRVVEAYGRSSWDQPQGSGMSRRLSTAEHVSEVLAAADLPARFAAALDFKTYGLNRAHRGRRRPQHLVDVGREHGVRVTRATRPGHEHQGQQ